MIIYERKPTMTKLRQKNIKCQGKNHGFVERNIKQGRTNFVEIRIDKEIYNVCEACLLMARKLHQITIR